MFAGNRCLIAKWENDSTFFCYSGQDFAVLQKFKADLDSLRMGSAVAS